MTRFATMLPEWPLLFLLASCGGSSAPPPAAGTWQASAAPAQAAEPARSDARHQQPERAGDKTTGGPNKDAPSHLCPCRALAGTDGVQHDLTPHGEDGFTVLVFYADCPVMHAHAPRLRAWSQRYLGAGVRFYAIASEASVTLSDARVAVREEGYPFPVLLDPGAKIADALDARVAAYAVVIDRNGSVQYAGGLDSDRAQITSGASLYLVDALDDLVQRRPVRRTSGKALGCALRTR